ncbi:surface glycan-binding family protein [Bacteroides congonensis]|uniref:surface glycan-binding family protein n=1 Tax=Bacteroides congonensis TaxID=1871006 RepID=UPI0003393A41|nr:surface glycan-binding family protein [Bacteroides congonensis]CDA84782.1 putative uncharacterized protein [Bacteroides sp. CAG:754]
MNLKDLFTKCLMFLAISLLGHLAVSCTDTEETDSSNFALYYYGVTDIGPSMNFELKEPSYIGGAPYDFAITNITLKDESYSTESFVINESTGAITIQNTENLSTGLYKISVSCYSNGKYYEFKDIVQVNILLAAPEGITVIPSDVIVNLDEEKWEESSAQVTTEKDTHISIIGYDIAADGNKDYLDYFTVSETGKITIVSKYKDRLEPGKQYTLSLKLTTRVDEYIYADAVTFSVVAKPYNLEYSPKNVNVEYNVELTSGDMSIQGSPEEMAFRIKSISPTTDAFKIDPSTGKITLKENNGLEVGSIFKLDITVSNKYGERDFPEAYTVNIIDFMDPVDENTFKYKATNIYEGQELKPLSYEEGLIGDDLTFSLATDNSDEILKLFKVEEKTGEISMVKANTLKANDNTPYEIKVTASNYKSNATTTFKLTVMTNPNMFTFVSYGTNLENTWEVGQKTSHKYTKEKNPTNRNLFRYINKGNIPLEPLTILDSDLPNGSNFIVEYSIDERYTSTTGGFKYTEINSSTGEINLDPTTTSESDKNRGGNIFTGKFEGGVLLIKVTVSNTDPEIPPVTKRIPLFFNTPKKTGNNLILTYTPFVVKANPRTGICSQSKCEVVNWNSQKINSFEDMSKVILDFRGGNLEYLFYRFNDNENHGSSAAGNASSLINNVFANYASSQKINMMSYYLESDRLGAKPAYIQPGDFQIKINPGKWIGSDNEYANGVVIAKVRGALSGTQSDLDSDGTSIPVFPVFIWLDENF